MTAKEKSKELIQKYFDLFSNLGYYASLSEAKSCALITVQEIINTGSLEPQLKRHKLQKVAAKIFEVEYWFEVKKEINEL